MRNNVLGLSLDKIEDFFNKFNFDEICYLKSLIYKLKFVIEEEDYENLLRLVEFIEIKKIKENDIGEVRICSKMEELSMEELYFLSKLIDSASYSNLYQIDEYIEEDEDIKDDFNDHESETSILYKLEVKVDDELRSSKNCKK